MRKRVKDLEKAFRDGGPIMGLALSTCMLYESKIYHFDVSVPADSSQWSCGLREDLLTVRPSLPLSLPPSLPPPLLLFASTPLPVRGGGFRRGEGNAHTGDSERAGVGPAGVLQQAGVATEATSAPLGHQTKIGVTNGRGLAAKATANGKGKTGGVRCHHAIWT